MEKEAAKIRIAKLSREIDKNRRLYHVLDQPEITDEVYDSLTEELRKLEEQFPEFLSATSPTQRVGGQPLDKAVGFRARHDRIEPVAQVGGHVFNGFAFIQPAGNLNGDPPHGGDTQLESHPVAEPFGVPYQRNGFIFEMLRHLF